LTERIAVLKRIATDLADRVAREIEATKATKEASPPFPGDFLPLTSLAGNTVFERARNFGN
jgi:hypothetical protein